MALRSAAHVDVRRWRRQLHDDVDERVDVTGADGDDHRLELSATLGGQPSDVAEVEDRQVFAVGEQEVPRMRIGVVDAVAEDHLQVDVGGPVHEHVDVPPGRLDAGPIGERMADDHRHRQHLLARPLGVGLGDDDVGLVGEVEPEPLEVGQLLAQIDRCFHHRRRTRRPGSSAGAGRSRGPRSPGTPPAPPSARGPLAPWHRLRRAAPSRRRRFRR